MMIVAAMVMGYLLGSIPTGYLIGRAKGVDIRAHGSGNIGATNVLRTLGKPLGILAFVGDTGKGFAAVWAGYLLHETGAAWPISAYGVTAGLACIVGHNHPCWLKFKGGKGIATSAGVLTALMPLAIPVLLVIWLILFAATRYVSVASIGAALALPVIVGLLGLRVEGYDQVLLGFAVVAALLAIWRHRSNIQRLREGTENRFGRSTS